MSSGVPTRVIAACCALAGFAIAIIVGLAAENPADVVLVRALVALVACKLLGWIIGSIGEWTVRSSIAAATSAQSVNTSSPTSQSSNAAGEEPAMIV